MLGARVASILKGALGAISVVSANEILGNGSRSHSDYQVATGNNHLEHVYDDISTIENYSMIIKDSNNKEEIIQLEKNEQIEKAQQSTEEILVDSVSSPNLAIGEEVDSALESIKSNADMFRGVLPQTFFDLNHAQFVELFQEVKMITANHEQFVELCQGVKMIAEDPKMISTMNHNLLKKRQDVRYEKGSNETDEALWGKLQKLYPCAICCDVLSAPVILNCEHSYCGVCLNQLQDSCKVATEDDIEPFIESGVQVVCKCPTCQVEIADSIFERNLDVTILEAVNQLNDSEYKRQWSERRNQYMAYMKEQRIQSEKQKKLQKNMEADRVASSAEDDAWWEETKPFLVGALLFAVIILVTTCRK